MWGGVFGLPYVPQERWGGLPITLILATFGLAFAFPLAILVALGRRSNLPAIKVLCVLYVELIRGVPLISLLFMASVMFPLFLPEGMNIDKLLRAQIAIILFAGAYSRRWCAAACRRCPRAVRGGRRARPVLLEEDRLHHPAAGAAHRDPAAGQHLHRLLQGHLAGADHRHLRPADAGRPRSSSPPGRASASRSTSSSARSTSSSASRCRSTARGSSATSTAPPPLNPQRMSRQRTSAARYRAAVRLGRR
jgi:His/Glu/Gln/Arg/opine family amino acid ABC transporter permease subunit